MPRPAQRIGAGVVGCSAREGLDVVLGVPDHAAHHDGQLGGRACAKALMHGTQEQRLLIARLALQHAIHNVQRVLGRVLGVHPVHQHDARGHDLGGVELRGGALVQHGRGLRVIEIAHREMRPRIVDGGGEGRGGKQGQGECDVFHGVSSKDQPVNRS